MRSIFFYSSAVFSTTIQALAFWAPRETFIQTIAADSISPRPTLPASFQGLRKRQSSSSDTFLIGPDQTCGYISGLPGAGFACDSASDSCVLVPATSATPGFVGCCDDQDCGFRVTCLDYDQVSSSSLCDDGCMVDTFTVKCTETTEQFCNTVSFPGDIYDFFCNSLSISTPQLALTTYDGETDGRVFITTVVGDDSSSDLPTTSARTRQSTSTTESSSSTTFSSSTSTSSGPSSAPGTSGSAASSTPIGPIVGGAVGGVAVIGIIALGIVFILRRKNSPAPTVPQPGYPPVAPNHQPPTTPDPHSFYVPPPGDPTKHNSAVLVNGQPMTQTHPTPPPPFPGQPYHAPPPPEMMQAGYYHASGGTTPVSAGEYSRVSAAPPTTAPVSPSTTMASHPSYQPAFAQTLPGAVHEIGDGGHRGTMSELG